MGSLVLVGVIVCVKVGIEVYCLLCVLVSRLVWIFLVEMIWMGNGRIFGDFSQVRCL